MLKFWEALYLTGVSTGSPSRGGDVTVYIPDINQPILPTPFYSVLVSVSDIMALSTVFHSIKSPNNSPLSHSVHLVLFCLIGLLNYISLYESFLSHDVILCGWLGLKHHLTNYLHTMWRCFVWVTKTFWEWQNIQNETPHISKNPVRLGLEEHTHTQKRNQPIYTIIAS